MARFYRHVLLEKHFPHHGAVLYGSYSAALFDLFACLDVPYIGYNRRAGDLYERENPFCLDGEASQVGFRVEPTELVPGRKLRQKSGRE
jgi:hypothetical protein